jgi:hypothetical protein
MYVWSTSGCVAVVKAAGKMQKEVTEKRSEIDTVMGQIRMLEEKLEAANRV